MNLGWDQEQGIEREDRGGVGVGVAIDTNVDRPRPQRSRGQVVAKRPNLHHPVLGGVPGADAVPTSRHGPPPAWRNSTRT